MQEDEEAEAKKRSSEHPSIQKSQHQERPSPILPRVTHTDTSEQEDPKQDPSVTVSWHQNGTQVNTYLTFTLSWLQTRENRERIKQTKASWELSTAGQGDKGQTFTETQVLQDSEERSGLTTPSEQPSFWAPACLSQADKETALGSQPQGRRGVFT